MASSSAAAAAAAAAADGKNRSSRLFQYPPLPKWEKRLYQAVMTFFFGLTWFYTYQASANYETSVRGIGTGKKIKSWLPLIGDVKKDTSNYEWNHFRSAGVQMALGMAAHSIVFNVSAYFLLGPTTGDRRVKLWRIINFVGSTLTCMYIFTVENVLGSFIHGFILLGVTYFVPYRLAIFLAAAPLIQLNLYYPGLFILPGLGKRDRNIFLSITYVSYKLIAYLSFCSVLYDNHQNQQRKRTNIVSQTRTENSEISSSSSNSQNMPHQENIADLTTERTTKNLLENASTTPPNNNGSTFFDNLCEMYSYSMYMPYAAAVIMVYPMFRERLWLRIRYYDARKNVLEAAWKGARFGFWFIFLEVTLRLVHHEYLTKDLVWMNHADLPTLCSLLFMNGNFFFIKYVIIFGLPSIFAQLDGMDPLPGPLCISCNSLFSRVWRGFDRGLYMFFKYHIYKPICEPTFSISRKLIGAIVANTFVLVWHGFTPRYIWWIILSLASLLFEMFGKVIYSLESVQKFRERYLSDLNFRRLLAWLQIIPFSFSLYSLGYFLCGYKAAGVWVQRIFLNETVTLRPPFFALIGIGYCFSHWVMDIDRQRDAQQAKRTAERKALIASVLQQQQQQQQQTDGEEKKNL